MKEMACDGMSQQMNNDLGELSAAYEMIEQAVQGVKKFCRESGHPVRIDSRSTVEQMNKKTKVKESRITELPDSQIYSLWWVCKHFGKRQVRHNHSTPEPHYNTDFGVHCGISVINRIWDWNLGDEESKSAESGEDRTDDGEMNVWGVAEG